jgi:hypothetical protein
MDSEFDNSKENLRNSKRIYDSESSYLQEELDEINKGEAKFISQTDLEARLEDLFNL